MGSIKVTKKAAFIPVFSPHNPWGSQIGFSINVLIVSKSHTVWWQSVEGSLWSRNCREGKMCRCKTLHLQSLGTRGRSLRPQVRPGLVSLTHFWQLQGVSVKAILCLAALCLTGAVISLMTWVLPSSIAPPPLKLPSHQPGFIFSGRNLNLLYGDARCHPQRL